MKCQKISYLLLIVVWDVIAAEHLEIKLVTHAMCSPAVGINYGNVTINCLDKRLENRLRELPDLSKYNNNMSQLISLRSEVEQVGKELREVVIGNSPSSKSIELLENKLRSIDKKNLVLQRSHEELRAQLANKLASVPEIVQKKIEKSVPIISRSVAETVIDQQLKKISRKIVFDIDYKLQDNLKKFGEITQRVDVLESDVSFLMSEFLDGKLQNNEGFIGIAIGGHFIENDWQPSFDIEYELLLPQIEFIGLRGSMLFDLTLLDWKNIQSYETLPGVSPISVENDHSSILFSLGTRLFFANWSDNTHSYFGALFGHTISGNEDSFYYSLSFGTEYFLRSRRIAFELRWEDFSNIESEVSLFKPLGSATTRNVFDSISGYYVGARISFR